MTCATCGSEIGSGACPQCGPASTGTAGPITMSEEQPATGWRVSPATAPVPAQASPPYGSPTGAPPAGVTVGAPSRFCRGCGLQLVPTASSCPRCGTATGSPRTKTTAVLLAVFLGHWTWLYTYDRNKTKFWWGLGAAILGAILTMVLVGFLVLFGVWLWAVIDTATTPDEFYTRFPNG